VTSDDDEFDLNEFKAPPAMVERTAGVPKRVKKRRQQFAKVPRAWVDAIGHKSRDKTFVVVWHLLHEHWKRGGGEIKVSNGMLALDGVGRNAKWRVLNMLEKAGLISIDRRDRKSPIVRLNANPEVA
jgi:hypothetical protein